MDKVLRDTLISNMKKAKDETASREALTLAMIAMVKCQQKTSMRVKYLFWLITVATVGFASRYANASLAQWLARF